MAMLQLGCTMEVCFYKLFSIDIHGRHWLTLFHRHRDLGNISDLPRAHIDKTNPDSSCSMSLFTLHVMTTY